MSDSPAHIGRRPPPAPTASTDAHDPSASVDAAFSNFLAQKADIEARYRTATAAAKPQASPAAGPNAAASGVKASAGLALLQNAVQHIKDAQVAAQAERESRSTPAAFAPQSRKVGSTQRVVGPTSDFAPSDEGSRRFDQGGGGTSSEAQGAFGGQRPNAHSRSALSAYTRTSAASSISAGRNYSASV